MTIEEIFEKHPTTLSYEEDARYVYHERQTLLIAEIDRLKADLALNAKMLARQCDLARQAEAELAALKTEKEKPEKKGV